MDESNVWLVAGAGVVVVVGLFWVWDRLTAPVPPKSRFKQIERRFRDREWVEDEHERLWQRPAEGDEDRD